LVKVVFIFCGAGILNFFEKSLIKKLRYYFNLPALERFYAFRAGKMPAPPGVKANLVEYLVNKMR